MSNDHQDDSVFDDVDHIEDLGPCSQGSRHVLMRKDGQPVRVGHARKIPDGAPLPPGKNVCFTDDDGHIIHRMKVEGPAQVATPAYRSGWDQIFGTKKKRRSELN